MSEYDQYVNAVNKIFDIVEKMKLKNIDQDELTYIENIENYKQIVIENAKLFDKNKAPIKMEELGNE